MSDRYSMLLENEDGVANPGVTNEPVTSFNTGDGSESGVKHISDQYWTELMARAKKLIRNPGPINFLQIGWTDLDVRLIKTAAGKLKFATIQQGELRAGYSWSDYIADMTRFFFTDLSYHLANDAKSPAANAIGDAVEAGGWLAPGEKGIKFIWCDAKKTVEGMRLLEAAKKELGRVDALDGGRFGGEVMRWIRQAEMIVRELGLAVTVAEME